MPPSSSSSPSSSAAPARWLPFVILGLGVAAISFGAIFARLAQAEGYRGAGTHIEPGTAALRIILAKALPDPAG